jgi:YegS/Rv2252/BmrU family lipid kinase
MKKATLIFNPRAGQLNMAAKVEPVADYWRGRGWRVTLQPTQAPGHATELARRAAESGEHVVLAAGGDGTMGQVANGLAGSETILAPLPIGTSNALARELRLPRPQLLEPNAPLDASEALLAGRVQRVDLNYVRSQSAEGYALLWTGVGADGFIVQQIEPRPTWSKRLGPLGYSLQALSLIHRLPAMRAIVQVDDQTIEADLLLVVISTTRLYAGGLIELSSGALFDDGTFEVSLFRAGEVSAWLEPPRAGLMARYLTEVQLNLQEWDPGVINLSGQRVSIDTQPTMPCQTDGESAGYSPLTCEVRPGALRLLAPSSAPAGLFTRPGVPLEEIRD